MICCTKCKETKQDTDFYFDKNGNRYKSNCKECCNKVDRVRMERDKEQICEKRRIRYLKYRQEIIAKERIRYRKNKSAAKARLLARTKIEKKPCEICGELSVDRHHNDYSKPLDVIFLCRRHHMRVHSGLLKV